MVEKQKQLLADIRMVADDALKLYNAGVKIPNVIQKLRDACNEMQTRVEYLEREGKEAEKPKAPKAAKAPKADKPSDN